MVITFRDPEVKWQINAQHNEERLSRGPARVLLASLPIEIDYSLRGRRSVIAPHISHPGRLNSTLAIFINLCLSVLDTEKKKL